MRLISCLHKGVCTGVQYLKTGCTFVAKARVRMRGSRDNNYFRINLY